MGICREDTLEQRFWPKVKIGEPDECWEWQAAENGDGYGHIGKGNGMVSSHRVAWELTHGPIPDGLCVLHKCDNRKCCNERHLFLGTNMDNILDMVNKGRSLCGIKHRNARLTEEQVRDIKSSSLSIQELSEKHSCSVSHVINIQANRFWKHITATPTAEKMT